MGTVYNDVLHTYSPYGPNNYMPRTGRYKFNQRRNYENNIKALREKENTFYSAILGTTISSFGEFVRQVKEKLSKFQQDTNALRQLDNDRLTQALYRKYGFSTKGQWDQDATFSRLVVKLDASVAENTLNTYIKEIEKTVIAELQKIGQVGKADLKLSVSGNLKAGTLTIDFGLDKGAIEKKLDETGLLKGVVNAAMGRKLKVEAQSLEWFKNQILNDPNLISLTTNKKEFVWEANSKLRTKDREGNANPFAISKKGLAKKNISQQQQIEEEIKSFIMTTIGYSQTSQDFQNVFQEAWRTQISSRKLGIAGYTWNGAIANIVGAFGEFQTYVLFQYISHLFGGKAQGKIADAFASGEQMKADIQFFQGFGIQVKNYSGYGSELKELKFNIHPNKLIQYPQISEWIGSSFSEYIANYYFNKDINRAPFASIIDGLKRAFAEIASMGTTDDVPDTVCLYNLGGGYLIPASDLLEQVYLRSYRLDDTQVAITSAFEGSTNKEFHKKKKGKDGKQQEPAFLKYWERDGESWKPKDENRNLYAQMLNSKISIRAVVPYEQFLREGYKLW